MYPRSLLAMLAVAGCASAPLSRSARPAALPEEVTVIPVPDPDRVEGPIPHLQHPPLDAHIETRPLAPMRISIDEIGADDYRGTARLFMSIADISRAHYALELGGGLPDDAADGYLGPRLPFPAQERPYAIVTPDSEGRPAVGDLVPTATVASLMVEAELAMRHEATEQALERFERVTALQPTLAKGWVRVAELRLTRGELEPAREALASALERTPLDPFAHALLAEVELRSGKRRRARRALAHALALYPAYPPAMALVPATTGGPMRDAIFRPPARVSVPEPGTILVEADTRRTGVWLSWAMCQATTRFEPDRSLLPFDEEPFGVHLRRELACALSLADAATSPIATLGTRTQGIPDPAVQRLARIAEAGYIGEFTLYEVIAPRFPALLLHLSDEQRLRIIAYVDRFVLPPGPERMDN